MSRFRTDAVALTCILFGAAAGGAATFALMNAREVAGVGCAVATVDHSPRVVIAVGGKEAAYVVRPQVRVHTSHDCAAVRIREAVAARQAVEIQERIHISMEALEREMEEVQLHVEGIELEKLEMLESALEVEMQQLEERLEKVGGRL